MDAIRKALKKMSAKERTQIKEILAKLSGGKMRGLDIKKLQGRDDIFRVRKGDIRIVYRKTEKTIFVLLIERCNEKTYNL